MDTFATFNVEKVAKMFKCYCGNIYKHSQGLSKHKKNCKKVAESSHSDECSKEEINRILDSNDPLQIINYLLKESTDLHLWTFKTPTLF